MPCWVRVQRIFALEPSRCDRSFWGKPAIPAQAIVCVPCHRSPAEREHVQRLTFGRESNVAFAKDQLVEAEAEEGDGMGGR